MDLGIDESTVRTIDNGRATLGQILSAAQSQLQKVFIVFLIGFLGAFYALRMFIIPYLKSLTLVHNSSAIATTPFDVILLQTKFSLICGVLIAVPALLYVSRGVLRERGWLPSTPLSRWKSFLIAILAVSLFATGMLYAFYVFFPMLFDFLVNNTNNAGLQPTYAIVKWFSFLTIMSLAIGMAAELPLIMTSLAYAGIVRYETFKSKWRHAVVIIFVLGAAFSPPDPITQLMWAMPMIVLYAFSLLLTKFVITAKRSSDQIGLGQLVIDNWYYLTGLGLLSGFLAYKAIDLGARTALNEFIRSLGYGLPTVPLLSWIYPFANPYATYAFATTVAVVVMVVFFVIQLFRSVDTSAELPVRSGDPADIDISELDANSIAVAPDEAFTSMTEDEAVAHAGRAMEADDNEKAQAILDRFDEAAAEQAEQTDAEGSDTQESDEEGNVITQTTSGMLSSFTEEEQTEDDIGGYFYDIRFIFSSLTSKMFQIVGVFLVVMGIGFTALFRGGLKTLKADFLSRLPERVRPEEVNIVTLHPVEALMFALKLSAIFGFVAVLPVIVYHIWPALKERGFIGRRQGRGSLFLWSVSSLAALVAGSVIGYAIVAPNIISWLASDTLRIGMVIKYQINAAGWLVFFTTVGVGLLATIPVTVFFLYHTGLVAYSALVGRWREVVVGVFIIIAAAAPQGVFGMFLYSLPVVFAYLLGLVLVWIVTLGGRRGKKKKPQSWGV